MLSRIESFLPTKYLEARRALAAERRVDAVKTIRDKSIAIEVYAYQAKDGQLAADAAEIKKRAERRIYQLLQERPKATGARATGGPGRGKRGVNKPPRLMSPETYAEQGIDKDLAKRVRASGRLDDDAFEKEIERTRKLAVAAAEGDRAIVRNARAEQLRKKKARRQEREAALGQRICALPDQRFGVILEDFEFDFEVHSRDTGMDRHASNHYETSADAHTPAEIVERTKDRFAVAADDCVLFMWVPIPHLFIGLKVMELRGFEYKSGFVWGKDKIGTGFWNRECHEHLLIGVRGAIPAPALGDQFDSLLMALRGEHSEKPDFAYEIIERYFPTLPKIELNARSGRQGWISWGNEAPMAADAAE